jgi:hypothetical protein
MQIRPAGYYWVIRPKFMPEVAYYTGNLWCSLNNLTFLRDRDFEYISPEPLVFPGKKKRV